MTAGSSKGTPQPRHPGEALERAIAEALRLPPDAKARADFLVGALARIADNFDGWKATLGRGTDGAYVFYGMMGHVRVVAPDGRIFAGRIDGRGLKPASRSANGDFTWTIDYRAFESCSLARRRD